MTQKQTFAKFPGYVLFALVDDPSAKPGWDILDLITGDHIETGHYEAIGVAQGYENHGCMNSPSVLSGYRAHVMRRTQFLMGQQEANIVTSLTEKATAAEKLAKERDEAFKSLSADLTKALDCVKGLENDRTRALDERKTMSATKDKLEADMGKLKRVLGEKTINDVLNPPA